MTQRCKHVAAIRERLLALGATSIRVERNAQRIHVRWTLMGRSCSIAIDAYPRDEVVARNTGRQAMRRACREVRAS